MLAVKNNPYRILGLLANATAREQERQTKRLKKYIEAGQEPPQDDYSFPALGKLTRNMDAVVEAVSKLDLDSDKMNSAMFWFYMGKEITDEPAFDALKEGNIDAACQIWDALITERKEDGKQLWKPVTEKNYSAFHNYFVASLLLGNGNLQNAVVGNLHLLESDLYQKIVLAVTDATYKTTKNTLQLASLNALVEELDASTVVKIVENIHFSAKTDFIKGISQRFVAKINSNIEIAKKKRGVHKSTANKAGEMLYNNAKGDLSQLRSIVGEEDFAYSNIADKVANEILQCGIVYFKCHENNQNSSNNLGIPNAHLKYTGSNSSHDFAKTAMELFEKAKSLAVGNITKQRVEENIDNLYRDCYRAIELLRSIKEIYIQLFQENNMWPPPLPWEKKVVDETKVLDFLKQELTDAVVCKMAASNNQSLIDEFYKLLEDLMGNNYSMTEKIKIVDKSLLYHVEKILCDNLPDTSTLKKTISSNIMKRERQEEERKEKARIEVERRKQQEIDRIKRQKRESEKKTVGCLIIIVMAVICAIIGGAAGEFAGMVGGLFLGGVIVGPIVSQIVQFLMD